MESEQVQSMKALVTGGTGFVGRAVVARLLDIGASVTLLRRAATEVAQRPSRDGVSSIEFSALEDVSSIVEDAAPDVVMHLAAEHRRVPRGSADVAALLEANVSLGAHVLEGLRESRAIVVNANSYFQYLRGRPSPHSLYAATKQAFVEIAEYHRAVNGTDVRNVVLYDNYGPGDTRDKLIPQLLAGLNSRTVVRVGPLDQRLNLLHVDDVAAGLLAAIQPGTSVTTTVRAHRSTSVGDVIRILGESGARDLQVHVDGARKTSDHPEVAGDWPTPPSWSPERSLDQELRKLARLSMPSP